VQGIADARNKAADTRCDGIMIGRGMFGNPWLFSEHEPTPRERIDGLLEHLTLFEEKLGRTTHYAVMKKHYKAYINGWDNAKDLRVRLMDTNDVPAAVEILKNS
jgi:tRNA-dihydrouridine synthase